MAAAASSLAALGMALPPLPRHPSGAAPENPGYYRFPPGHRPSLPDIQGAAGGLGLGLGGLLSQTGSSKGGLRPSRRFSDASSNALGLLAASSTHHASLSSAGPSTSGPGADLLKDLSTARSEIAALKFKVARLQEIHAASTAALVDKYEAQAERLRREKDLLTDQNTRTHDSIRRDWLDAVIKERAAASSVSQPSASSSQPSSGSSSPPASAGISSSAPAASAWGAAGPGSACSPTPAPATIKYNSVDLLPLSRGVVQIPAHPTLGRRTSTIVVNFTNLDHCPKVPQIEQINHTEYIREDAVKDVVALSKLLNLIRNDTQVTRLREDGPGQRFLSALATDLFIFLRWLCHDYVLSPSELDGLAKEISESVFQPNAHSRISNSAPPPDLSPGATEPSPSASNQGLCGSASPEKPSQGSESSSTRPLTTTDPVPMPDDAGPLQGPTVPFSETAHAASFDTLAQPSPAPAAAHLSTLAALHLIHSEDARAPPAAGTARPHLPTPGPSHAPTPATSTLTSPMFSKMSFGEGGLAPLQENRVSMSEEDLEGLTSCDEDRDVAAAGSTVDIQMPDASPTGNPEMEIVDVDTEGEDDLEHHLKMSLLNRPLSPNSLLVPPTRPTPSGTYSHMPPLPIRRSGGSGGSSPHSHGRSCASGGPLTPPLMFDPAGASGTRPPEAATRPLPFTPPSFYYMSHVPFIGTTDGTPVNYLDQTTLEAYGMVNASRKRKPVIQPAPGHVPPPPPTVKRRKSESSIPNSIGNTMTVSADWRCTWCLLPKKFTPYIRKGPGGQKSLCNACGLYYARHGRLSPDNKAKHLEKC